MVFLEVPSDGAEEPVRGLRPARRRGAGIGRQRRAFESHAPAGKQPGMGPHLG